MDKIDYLITKDELCRSQKNSEVLTLYIEPKITFTPTSIYNPYSTVYKLDAGT